MKYSPSWNSLQKQSNKTQIKIVNQQQTQEKIAQNKNTQVHEKSHKYGVRIGLSMPGTEDISIAEEM